MSLAGLLVRDGMEALRLMGNAVVIEAVVDPGAQYSLSEVAEFCNLKTRQVERAAKAGKLAAYRIVGGGKWWVLGSEVIRFRDTCIERSGEGERTGG